MDFEGGGSGAGADRDDDTVGGGGDGAGDLKECQPCCAFIVGIVLFMVSTYGIWNNEGDYVKIQEVLADATERAKEPCYQNSDGSCAPCDYSDVKAGDLVFVSCNLENLKKVDSLKRGFKVPELTGMIAGEERAAKFWYAVSEFQFEHSKTTQDVAFQGSGTESGVTLHCASGLTDDNDPSARRRVDECCSTLNSEGYRYFEDTYVSDFGTCQSWVDKDTCKTEAQTFNRPSNLCECPHGTPVIGVACTTNAAVICAHCNAGYQLVGDNCQAAPATTPAPAPLPAPAPAPAPTPAPVPTPAPAAAPPPPPAPAPDPAPAPAPSVVAPEASVVSAAQLPIVVLGADFVGGGIGNSSTAEVSKQDGAALVAEADAEYLTDDLADFESAPELGFESAPAPARKLESSRKQDERRRRTTVFHCSFACHHFGTSWERSKDQGYEAWPVLPRAMREPEVAFVTSPLAKNLAELPIDGEYSNVVSGEQGVAVGGFSLNRFPTGAGLWNEWRATPLLSHTPGTGSFDHERLAGSQGKKCAEVTYHSYSCNDSWTTENSYVNSDCIYSNQAAAGPTAGDLKVCFQQTALDKLSTIAEVSEIGGTRALVQSRKHLHPETKLGTPIDGYLYLKDTTGSKDYLIKQYQQENDMRLYIFRVLFPLMLWFGIYCCFTPITWLLDKVGDALDMIPCIGGFLANIMGLIEGLADCIICMISCTCAMGITLLVMGTAWLFYRPLIGICFLLGFFAFTGCTGYCVYANKGKGGKRRNYKAVMQQPLMANQGVVGMPMAQAQPVAQAQPLPNQMQVQCPPGASAGQFIQISTPDGRMMQVQVPEGIQEGMSFIAAI